MDKSDEAWAKRWETVRELKKEWMESSEFDEMDWCQSKSGVEKQVGGAMDEGKNGIEERDFMRN